MNRYCSFFGLGFGFCFRFCFGFRRSDNFNPAIFLIRSQGRHINIIDRQVSKCQIILARFCRSCKCYIEYYSTISSNDIFTLAVVCTCEGHVSDIINKCKFAVSLAVCSTNSNRRNAVEFSNTHLHDIAVQTVHIACYSNRNRNSCTGFNSFLADYPLAGGIRSLNVFYLNPAVFCLRNELSHVDIFKINISKLQVIQCTRSSIIRNFEFHIEYIAVCCNDIFSLAGVCTAKVEGTAIQVRLQAKFSISRACGSTCSNRACILCNLNSIAVQTVSITLNGYRNFHSITRIYFFFADNPLSRSIFLVVNKFSFCFRSNNFNPAISLLRNQLNHISIINFEFIEINRILAGFSRSNESNSQYITVAYNIFTASCEGCTAKCCIINIFLEVECIHTVAGILHSNITVNIQFYNIAVKAVCIAGNINIQNNFFTGSNCCIIDYPFSINFLLLFYELCFSFSRLSFAFSGLRFRFRRFFFTRNGDIAGKQSNIIISLFVEVSKSRSIQRLVSYESNFILRTRSISYTCLGNEDILQCNRTVCYSLVAFTGYCTGNKAVIHVSLELCKLICTAFVSDFVYGKRTVRIFNLLAVDHDLELEAVQTGIICNRNRQFKIIITGICRRCVFHILNIPCVAVRLRRCFSSFCFSSICFTFSRLCFAFRRLFFTRNNNITGKQINICISIFCEVSKCRSIQRIIRYESHFILRTRRISYTCLGNEDIFQSNRTICYSLVTFAGNSAGNKAVIHVSLELCELIRTAFVSDFVYDKRAVRVINSLAVDHNLELETIQTRIICNRNRQFKIIITGICRGCVFHILNIPGIAVNNLSCFGRFCFFGFLFSYRFRFCNFRSFRFCRLSGNNNITGSQNDIIISIFYEISECRCIQRIIRSKRNFIFRTGGIRNAFLRHKDICQGYAVIRNGLVAFTGYCTGNKAIIYVSLELTEFICTALICNFVYNKRTIRISNRLAVNFNHELETVQARVILNFNRHFKIIIIDIGRRCILNVLNIPFIAICLCNDCISRRQGTQSRSRKNPCSHGSTQAQCCQCR